MEPAELVNKIKNREDFLVFIEALLKDRIHNASSWENPDMESYLEALGRWVEDMDGYYINTGQEVPKNVDWKVFADILMAAKVYE